MWSQVVGICSLLALGSVAALGGSLDGKWVADANETVKSLIFVFKLSDGVLTGTAEAGSLGPVNLSNGKVDGDQISFEVTRSVLMTKVTTKYTGTIAGEVINLRGSNIRGSMDLVLRKK